MMEDSTVVFAKKLSNPLFFKLMLWFKLPLSAFTGVKLGNLDSEICEVYVKYKWLNKNPFNTMYWAVMGMAAELCSGLLLMMYAYHKKPGISMYVVACSGKFVKTGLGKIAFTCSDGKLIANMVAECMANKSVGVIDCITRAHNEKGELVAEFIFTWSIKGR
jgi:hypothetical protein